MYCAGCGATLPNGARFCPGCGEQSVSESEASDTGASSKLDVVRDDLSTGIGDAGLDPHRSNESAPKPRRASFDSITLALIAFLCIVLGAVQGFAPIFLIVGVVFGLLGYLCFAKHPLSESLRTVVFVISLFLAGVVGVALDQNIFGVRYRYFSQGSTQYRADERAGRTDRLGTHGWVPVAFEKPAQVVPMNGLLPAVTLSSGNWIANGSNGKICFNAANSSDYVIDRIAITVSLQNKSVIPQSVTLKSEIGAFIAAGDIDFVCGPGPSEM
jgi:hypothetical protein